MGKLINSWEIDVYKYHEENLICDRIFKEIIKYEQMHDEQPWKIVLGKMEYEALKVICEGKAFKYYGIYDITLDSTKESFIEVSKGIPLAIPFECDL